MLIKKKTGSSYFVPPHAYMIRNKSDKWTKLALLWAEESILSQQEKANRIKMSGENEQTIKAQLIALQVYFLSC